MPWHPGAGAGCSEQRPGGTVALGYIHTYILGGRYRDAVNGQNPVAGGGGLKPRAQMEAAALFLGGSGQNTGSRTGEKGSS